MALTPDVPVRHLREGLLDCESTVRRIAAEHVPLDDLSRWSLRFLRDDPLELVEVRDVAAVRLT